MFGHVHWGAGRELLRWDASQQAYESLMAEGASGWLAQMRLLPGRLFRLAVLLVAGVLSSAAGLAWPSAAASDDGVTVLINAAQMHGNTGRLGQNVQVIDL